MRSERLAPVLATLVVLAAVAGAAPGLVGATSTSAPPGMVTVPDDQVTVDLPRGVQKQLGVTNAELEERLEGEVMASRHADSLTVLVTTPGQARAKLGPNVDTIAGSGPIAVVVTDDTNSEGRRIALPAQTIEDLVGHTPRTFRGTHESGERWQTYTTVTDDGYLVGEVPHFSSNSVTFSGTLSITATPASDGSSYTYNVTDVDSVSDFNINITGTMNTAWDNQSATEVSSSGSVGLSVGGNRDPTGPSTNGEPVVQVTNPGQESLGSVTNSSVLDGASGIAVNESSGYAYITGQSSNSFVVADVSTPSSPSIVASITDSTLLNSTKDVAIAGDYAYVVAADSDRLTIVDISSPTNPSIVGDVKNTSHLNNPFAVDVDGNYAYVTSIDSAEMAVVDVSTPSSPSVVGSVAAQSPRGLDVDGNYAYVASGSQDGIYVIDVSSPSSPSTAGSISDSTNMDNADDVVVNGSTAYVAAVSSNSLAAVNVSNKSDPTLRGSVIDTSLNGPTSVTIEGDHVYTGGSNTLAAIDVSSPSSPTIDDIASGAPYNNPQAITVGASHVYTADATEDSAIISTQVSKVSSLDVSDGSGHTASFGAIDVGTTEQRELDIPLSTSSLSLSGSGGPVDVTVEFRERTLTEDVAIEVNGHTTSYSGTLSEGSTASLSTNASWIQAGENQVNVTVGDGSLSSDAPTPQVELEYSHDVVDNQSVSYEAEAWSERYNVSRTWSSEQTGATLTIPFDSSKVIAIRYVELRTNESGGWSSVSASSYSFDGTSLTVDLGTVQAGETIEVRAAGSKVQVHNGSITVLEPTAPGEDLQTKVELTSKSSGFYLEVNSSSTYTHYAYSESWNNPSDHVRVWGDGTQRLYLPDAGAGSTARIGRIPLEVEPGAGAEVDIYVEKTGAEPQIRVRPGPNTGETVDYRWHDTISGHRYQLYSVSANAIRDEATAQSPVVLSDDDSSETLAIYDLDSDDGGGGGAGGAGGPGQFATDGSGGLSLPIVVAILAVLLGVLYALARRSSSTGSGVVGRAQAAIAGNPLVLVAFGVILLFGLVLFGAVSLPPGGGLLLTVAGIPLVAFIGLKRLGEFNPVVFGTVSVIALVLGLELLGSGVVDRVLIALEPFLPVLAIAGIYLAYKGVQAARAPDEKTTLSLNVGDRGGGN